MRGGVRGGGQPSWLPPPGLSASIQTSASYALPYLATCYEVCRIKIPDHQVIYYEHSGLECAPERSGMPKAVSLFSGCGGSDAGVIAAGFDDGHGQRHPVISPGMRIWPTCPPPTMCWATFPRSRISLWPSYWWGAIRVKASARGRPQGRQAHQYAV